MPKNDDAPEPRTEPASRTLRLLLAAIEREMNRKAEAAVQAEAEDRGYPPDASYDMKSHAWTLPPEGDAEG